MNGDQPHCASRFNPPKVMPKETIDHLRKAAEHQEHAARHNLEAANRHARGSRDKARYHAPLALGHHVYATYHAEETAKYLAEADGTY